MSSDELRSSYLVKHRVIWKRSCDRVCFIQTVSISRYNNQKRRDTGAALYKTTTVISAGRIRTERQTTKCDNSWFLEDCGGDDKAMNARWAGLGRAGLGRALGRS